MVAYTVYVANYRLRETDSKYNILEEFESERILPREKKKGIERCNAFKQILVIVFKSKRTLYVTMLSDSNFQAHGYNLNITTQSPHGHSVTNSTHSQYM